MNEQLDVAPRDLQKKAKELYPEVVRTVLATALDEDKVNIRLIKCLKMIK